MQTTVFSLVETVLSYERKQTLQTYSRIGNSIGMRVSAVRLGDTGPCGVPIGIAVTHSDVSAKGLGIVVPGSAVGARPMPLLDGCQISVIMDAPRVSTEACL